MDSNIALPDDATDLKTPLSETLPSNIPQADSDDIPNSSSSNESDYSLNDHDALESDTFNSTNFEKNLPNMLEPIPKFFKSLAEGYYTWEIEDLDALSSDRTRSEIFVIANMEFNMLLVPSKRGNGLGYCLYLEGHPVGEKEGDDWFCPVQFAFDSWDPDDPTQHKQNSSRFRYSPRVTDWGFVQFLDYRAIFDNKLIRKNKVNFTAYVRVIDDYTEMLFHDLRDYDSKKMSGFVGIENQGATCYLNSLLQSYFSTKLFRKKVYEIPTEDEIRFDLPSFQDYLSQNRSVSLALQRIFYKLQTSDTAIDTLELTQSFGWTTADAFTQHDVQELNRILMDRLESKMKSTAIEGCLNDIFVGKMNSFIRCINVDYESSRTEDFWDIQLNVKGLKNIKESFENYVELELLDGDNKYDASSYGLQDAEKGVIFESFPPVLHLQLKRFEYDFEYDQLVKINDRYEFFESIDLKPYLSKSAPGYEDEDWEYKLHGVLVHQGDVSIGHYFAMIKPTIEDKWFRFDDDKVYRVTENDVFEANFGADKLDADPKKMTREEHNEYQLRRHTSAYMLVYIRQSKIPEVLAEVEEVDIPPHIPKQINYEKEENARIKKEREEMHFYANFKVYTNQGFLKYQGFDLGPNEYDRQDFAEGLYDPESSALSFRLLKTESFDKVFEKVAELLGYDKGDVEPLKNFRFWHMIPRSNSTFRPHRAIDYEYNNPALADITVEHVAKFCELGYGRKKYSGIEETTQISLFLEDITRELKYVSNAIIDLRKRGRLPIEVFDSNYFDKNFNDVVDISKKEIKPKLESVEENSRNILIFLKYFDIAKQTLKGVTHVLVPHDNTIDSLGPLLITLFGFPVDTSLAYIEEFGHERRLSIDISKTFYKSELEHGDIICFTRKITQDDSKNYEFKCMEDLYSFMAYRVHFHISALEKIEEDEEEYVFVDEAKNEKVLKVKTDPFDVWITRMADYEVITKKIAQKVGCNPTHLRLFIFDNGRKYALPSTFNFSKELARVSKSYILDLRYEILSVSLQEFEQMKFCRVYWVGHGICREQKHEFFMPRSSTIDHLVDRLQTKINIKNEDRDNLFGWSIDRYHRVEKILSLESQIEDACDIVVGIYPNFKEISFAPEERLKEILLVSGFQFFGQIDNTHSLPFLFDIVKDEPFKDTLIRLHKLLGLSDKKFNSMRVGVTDLNKVEYLDPKEKEEFVLFTAFHKMRDLYLVVEHPDRSSRKASTFEPSIFIKE